MGRTIEEVIEELNKELFSIGEQVGEEIKSGKINDTPYSRGMLQGIAMVAVCVENRGNEILEIHKAEHEPILDKIRTEIEQTTSRYTISRERGAMGQVEWSDRLIKESEVLEIIDKYKTGEE